MPSISLPKEISSPVQRFEWSFENSDPGTVAGAYLNDIAFNQPGWNEVVLTLNEIGCTAEVLDSIFVESPPDLASFDVDILPSDGCVPSERDLHGRRTNGTHGLQLGIW